MIELRDLILCAFAAGGAYAGTRVDVRALWRSVKELTARVTHLERQSMTRGK
jgi:hypothetical protein